MILRALLGLLALLSIFLFPWPLTIAVVLFASFFMPPVSLIAGILSDTLYLAPHAAAFPYATILGIIGFLIALGVHQFVKTRIIG